MKTSFKTLLLIIIAIIILSAGPLVYFTRAPAQIQLNQSNKNFLRGLRGNVTGTVVLVPTTLSYVGVSHYNSGNFIKIVNSTVAGIHPGCYMRTPTLNPYGQGYRYEIVCSLNSSEDFLRVGFKLYNRLHYFFTQDFYPNFIGRVMLPKDFVVGNETIHTSNSTNLATAVLYYSELNGSKVVINCPQFVINPSNALVKNPGLCIDNSYKGKLGLSPIQELFYSKTFNKTLDLNVTDYYGYGLKAEAKGNKTNEVDSSIITSLNYLQGSNKTIAYAESFNETEISNLSGLLKSKGFNVEEYRIGLALMPSRISAGSSYYFVPARLEKIKVKLGMNEDLGMKEIVANIKSVFDDVVSIQLTNPLSLFSELE